MSAQQQMEGLGFHFFWGNSFMRDLLADHAVLPGLRDGGSPNTRRILLVGCADIRHIIATVAMKLRHSADPGQKLEFYVFESSIESLARHALLLKLLNDSELPVRERIEMFLSIYGNSLLREKDANYVSSSVSPLIDLLTDTHQIPSASHLIPLLDFSLLKFKERDSLQEVFEGYRDSVKFDADALRDQRCRGFFKERFNNRKNLLDWNYSMCLKKIVQILSWQEYKSFGLTGVAFETRLGGYDRPNRTLASYLPARVNGSSVLVRGFWADIVNSPFICFSQDSLADRERLFKQSNGVYRQCAYDIADYNLHALLSEAETGEAWRLPAERPQENVFPFASPLEGMRGDRILEETDSRVLKNFENVKVRFLTGELKNAIRKIPACEIIYFGGMATSPLLTPDLEIPTLPGGFLLIESLQAQVSLSADAKARFRKLIGQAAASRGWKPAGTLTESDEFDLPSLIEFRT